MKPASPAAAFASPAGSTPHHPSSPAVQTRTAWSLDPGNDYWATRIRDSLDELMAKCDGATGFDSDDIARGLCIEARHHTCTSRHTAGVGGCIYKAMASAYLLLLLCEVIHCPVSHYEQCRQFALGD